MGGIRNYVIIQWPDYWSHPAIPKPRGTRTRVAKGRVRSGFAERERPACARPSRPTPAQNQHQRHRAQVRKRGLYCRVEYGMREP